MPPVSSKQFWKANPNQMALPGMEEMSHPGAVHLSQGYHFTTKIGYGGVVMMAAHHPTDEPGFPSAELDWRAPSPADRGRRRMGEISWVGSNRPHKGLPTSMYGLGRTMARIKPRHSKDRTGEGEQWSLKATQKFGGPRPRNKWYDEGG